MTDIREVALKFECKKIRMTHRKAVGAKTEKEGVYELVIHIHDQDPDMLTLFGDGLGSRYMCAMMLLTDLDEPAPRPEREARKRIVTQAAMLAKDGNFQTFVHFEMGQSAGPSEEAAAMYIRQRCAIESRSELADNSVAADAYKKLYGQYAQWTETRR